MIELKDVTKKFGSFTAVDKLSLTVKKGEILGLLGPNGAGKTTTMRMITGFFPQTSGEIYIDSKNVFNTGIRTRENMGYLPERNPLYYDMRVHEYLEFVAKLKNIQDISAKVGLAIEKTGLAEMRNRLIGNLSKGYKQRVGIAQALINEPQVLILDEPTSGLDPKQIVEIRELIRSFAEEHTVILSTHILPEVNVTCDRVAIMNRGRLVSLDTPENLLDSFKKGTGADLYVEFRGNKNDGEKVLHRFTEEFVYEKEYDDHFLVKIPKTKEDIRVKLNQGLIKANLDVYEIYSRNPELEEVFISVVSEEEAS